MLSYGMVNAANEDENMVSKSPKSLKGSAVHSRKTTPGRLVNVQNYMKFEDEKSTTYTPNSKVSSKNRLGKKRVRKEKEVCKD